MDMHDHEAFDTFSLSDLHIYSDPACSSKEEQDLGNSFSSFRFKIAGSLPSEEIVFLGNLISLPKTDLKPQKPSRMKASKARASPPIVVPVKGGGRKSGNWLGRLFGACIPMV
ncbi:hypothetical protein L1987_75421 [Smallanthus sonchifolius]|uniref:Uncharacterized protein n=1 Tax=Smallanthus sonchifolius TaxID=185202 RepID=A0ACB9A4N3_9ASTR|nr:hypothetical protein L1987_75421 [Smallanthus sonchifolius]